MDNTEINLLSELVDNIVEVNKTLVKINENLSFMNRKMREIKMQEDELNRGVQ